MKKVTLPFEASQTPISVTDELVRSVYKDLCGLAERLMQNERRDHTLAATDLVHEAYLRLSKQPNVWENRGHFFSAAAMTMRCILVDHAKRRGRKKRIGGRRRISLDDDRCKVTEADDEVIPLDEILTKMAVTSPELAQVVELRFFVGLTIEQTAEVMGVSTSSVERSWRAAKTWISAKLQGSEESDKPR
jgi:RNA polymerase sigma factor (TIGR02999 family)